MSFAKLGVWRNLAELENNYLAKILFCEISYFANSGKLTTGVVKDVKTINWILCSSRDVVHFRKEKNLSTRRLFLLCHYNIFWLPFIFNKQYL
jgi:hypothetical protein